MKIAVDHIDSDQKIVVLKTVDFQKALGEGEFIELPSFDEKFIPDSSSLYTEVKAPASGLKSIWKKISKVIVEVGKVPKDGWNDFHKYKYVTEEDLLSKIKPILNKNGLVIFPQPIYSEHICIDITTSKGLVPTWFTRVWIRFTIADVDSGETLTSVWKGVAADNGDKGIYKGYTGCTKYFVMKTFQISSGEDDPEGNNGDESPVKQTPKDSKKAPKAPKSEDVEIPDNLTFPELCRMINGMVFDLSGKDQKKVGPILASHSKQGVGKALRSVTDVKQFTNTPDGIKWAVATYQSVKKVMIQKNGESAFRDYLQWVQQSG